MPEQRSTSPNDGSTRPGLVKAVRLFVLVAMAVSSHLAWVSLRGGIVFGCGPDSACDRVLHSRWAYWFGVPVSLFALAAYAVILVSTFSLRPGVPVARQRQAWNWLLTCAWAVGGAALWFVGLQFLSVHAVCPYCMVAHGAGLVTTVLLFLAAPLRPPRDARWDIERQIFISPRVLRRTLLIGAIAVGVLIGGQLIHQPKTHAVTRIGPAMGAPPAANPTNAPDAAPAPPAVPAAPARTPPPSAAQPPARAPALASVGGPGQKLGVFGGRIELSLPDVPMLGSPTNQQVVVSLYDYTCHHCRTMHAVLTEVQQAFSNSLSFITLPMPLDPTCNSTVLELNPQHTNACDYARLGLAVWRADRSKFQDFNHFIFKLDRPPPLAESRAYAAELVGTAPLERALGDPWVERHLALDIAIYEVAFRSGQGSMPQLILGMDVAVGNYTVPELSAMLVSRLGLKEPPLAR